MALTFDINFKYLQDSTSLNLCFYGAAPPESELGRTLTKVISIGKKASELLENIQFSGVSNVKRAAEVPEHDPPYYQFATLDDLENEGAGIIAEKIKKMVESQGSR